MKCPQCASLEQNRPKGRGSKEPRRRLVWRLSLLGIRRALESRAAPGCSPPPEARTMLSLPLTSVRARLLASVRSTGRRCPARSPRRPTTTRKEAARRRDICPSRTPRAARRGERSPGRPGRVSPLVRGGPCRAPTRRPARRNPRQRLLRGLALDCAQSATTYSPCRISPARRRQRPVDQLGPIMAAAERPTTRHRAGGRSPPTRRVDLRSKDRSGAARSGRHGRQPSRRSSRPRRGHRRLVPRSTWPQPPSGHGENSGAARGVQRTRRSRP